MTYVAVLMTCFNRRETTLRCLRHLYSQTGIDDVTLEVFLTDDGSTDGTGDAVRAGFPDVRVLQGTGSLYWAGGTRLADASAWPTRPDHLLWLNDDVVLAEDAVATLIATANATDQKAIVVGSLHSPDDGSMLTYGGYRQPDPRRPLALELLEPDGTVHDVATMNGNVVLVPAAVRDAIGPLDPHFRHNMADMDYGFRARAAGFRVVLAPSTVGTCRRNEAKGRWSDPSLPLTTRIRAVTAFDGLPPREWWTFTRRHCGRLWPRYFLGPYVRAVLGAARHPPTTTGSRHHKVVHVLGAIRRSGAELMLANGEELFRSLGFRSHIVSVATDAESEIAREIIKAGIPVEHIGSRVRWRTVAPFLRALRRIRPAIVHVHLEGFSLAWLAVARLARLPTIRTVHSTFEFRGWLRIRKSIERQVARCIGVRFVAVSPSVQANEAIRFRNPTTLIDNWFDDRRFRPPSEIERTRARDRLAISSADFVISVVGNCSVVKNHHELLRALALLPGDVQPVLLHVGQGELTQDEMALVAELRAESRVRFLGSMTDVQPVLYASDVFVMPSLYEGMGIAALEAMAVGVPSIVCDVPGLRDLAALSPAVRTVAPEARSIASELVEIAARRPTVPDLSLAAAARSRFGRERGVRSYVALYRSVVSHGDRSGCQELSA
jgi:glycosyltransferase involved in cell wall biosynthesis/GT2 family glycosyltransferase